MIGFGKGFLTSLELTFLKSETILAVLLYLCMMKSGDGHGESEYILNLPKATIPFISSGKVSLCTHGIEKISALYRMCTFFEAESYGVSKSPKVPSKRSEYLRSKSRRFFSVYH